MTPELPAQAVREAIVNAVVHRDYTSTGSVQVMLFKDRLEVWNPGRLPQGMTIDKLSSVHASRPVNPVLANPVYLTGYIEQMGTGTTDIIERCEKAGLRTPEFYQDEDFRTILWRPENGGADHKKDGATGHVTGHVTDHVTDHVKRLILVLRGDTKTRDEIMAIMGLKHRGNLRDLYLAPAISRGYVVRLYPDAVSRTDQAYYLTHKGLELLKKMTG